MMLLDTSLGSYLEPGVQHFVESLSRMVSFEQLSHRDGEV